MNKRSIIDIITTIVILGLSFLISLVFQNVFKVEEHITTLFVFAVFIISFLTQGYVYGIVSAIISVLAVNYAFTFPYFDFNFIIPVNLISAIVMIVIAILTSALTTKMKYSEMMKAESEKERMRANLLRAISHDLRTPLTTIYGSTTTLLENRQSFTKSQEDKILKGIKEDSEWLVRMVENLLSITKIDSGMVEIIKTPYALDELVDSAVLKFTKRYPKQEVTIEIPEDIVIIPMDAILIEQVLINLFENAVHHGKNLTKIILNVEVKNNKAIFKVIDDGCGIDEERLPHIFSGYQKKNEEFVESNKHNMGIGLSVCATIIKAHGGLISAYNNNTGGATFKFELDTEVLEDEQ